jgi:paraquat-inducible protein B
MKKKKSNPSLAIGAFIVGAIVLVFIALLFFSDGRLFAQKERVVMYFDGSVQGLQIGAPVKLKGVVLGEITDIQIIFQNSEANPHGKPAAQTVINAVTADLVMKRINSKGSKVKDSFFDEAIKNGLRAQLNFQSFLTGLLYVELDFYPTTPIKFYNLQHDYRELPTAATNFEELSKSFKEINFKGLVNNLDNVIQQITDLVSSGEIQKSLHNFNNAANAVENMSNSINKEVVPLGKNLNHTIAELDVLIKELNTQTPQVAQALTNSLNDLHTSMDHFNQATQSVSNTFSEDAPLANQLTITLQDISRSAQAFRNLSETLEQQPEALLRGKKIMPAGE